MCFSQPPCERRNSDVHFAYEETKAVKKFEQLLTSLASAERGPDACSSRVEETVYRVQCWRAFPVDWESQTSIPPFVCFSSPFLSSPFSASAAQGTKQVPMNLSLGPSLLSRTPSKMPQGLKSWWVFPSVSNLSDKDNFLHTEQENWHFDFPKFLGVSPLSPRVRNLRSSLLCDPKHCWLSHAPLEHLPHSNSIHTAHLQTGRNSDSDLQPDWKRAAQYSLPGT